MESDHASPTLERHQLTHGCDCPFYPQVGSLLEELSEARAEVRRLRTGAMAGRAVQRSDGWHPVTPDGWRGLVNIRRALWWAPSDSEQRLGVVVSGRTVVPLPRWSGEVLARACVDPNRPRGCRIGADVL